MNDAESGITKQVIDKGIDSLSERQKFIFDSMIQKNSVEKCSWGGEDIPWSEMIEAMENGGYCSACYKNLHDDD